MKEIIEWDRVLIRSGFLFESAEEGFLFLQENTENTKYLCQLLKVLNLDEFFDGVVFSPPKSSIPSAEWLGAVENVHIGAEGGPSDPHNIELIIMDTYVAGIVRWINYVGIQTTYSCDGHKEREPRLILDDVMNESLVNYIVTSLSDNKIKYVNQLFKNNTYHLQKSYEKTKSLLNRSSLLDVAESIYTNRTRISLLIDSAKSFRSSIVSTKS